MMAGSKGHDALTEEVFQPNDLCEDLICCVICYERFNEKRIPKALPCLHTFCKDCLQKSMESYRTLSANQPGSRSNKSKKKNEFPCPVCKEVIKIPENGLRGFKDDFRIRRFSELLKKRQGDSEQLSEATSDSDADSDPKIPSDHDDVVAGEKCGVCSYFKKCTAASVYCIECLKPLCEGCQKKHLQAAITSDHTVIPAGYGLPSDASCTQHPGEPQQYYCNTCLTSLCMTCTLSDVHAQHDMAKLKDVMTSTVSDIESLLAQTQEQSKRFETKLQQLEQLEQKVQAKEKSVTRCILVKTIDEIMRIKAKMSKMEKELQTMYHGKHQKIQEDRQKMKDQRKEMVKMSEILEKVSQHGQDVQVLFVKNHLCSKMEKMTAEQGKLSDEDDLLNFGKFDGLASDPELSRRSSLEAPSKSSILAEIRNVVSQMRQISTSHNVDNHYPQLTRVIGQKGTGEGEFIFPSGVTCLNSGDVIIADMHNNRLQIFTREGNFRRKFGSEPLKPCGLASTKDGNIVVTDCNPVDTSVKIFSPRGELMSSLGKGLLQYPFSVALDNRGRFVICDPAVNKIIILGHDGSLARRFGTKTKFAFYITVNSRDEILMSDWVNHNIRVFDQGGATLRKIASRGYEDGQVMIPLGLCTDRDDNIYVVDCKCSRVSVFGVTGRFLRHAIGPEEGISRSRAISISNDGTLVITSGDNRRDLPSDVRFYQL